MKREKKFSINFPSLIYPTVMSLKKSNCLVKYLLGLIKKACLYVQKIATFIKSFEILVRNCMGKAEKSCCITFGFWRLKFLGKSLKIITGNNTVRYNISMVLTVYTFLWPLAFFYFSLLMLQPLLKLLLR